MLAIVAGENQLRQASATSSLTTPAETQTSSATSTTLTTRAEIQTSSADEWEAISGIHPLLFIFFLILVDLLIH